MLQLLVPNVDNEKIFEKIPLNQSEYHPKMSRFMRGGFLLNARE